jgi:hypothetical protein
LDIHSALEAVAAVAVVHDVCRAATLLGASEALESVYGSLPPFELSVHDETIEMLERKPRDEWRNCWEKGSRLDPAKAIVAPTHPRAGGTFSVSFRVHDKTDGTELAPTAARCRAPLGHARARVSGARAICVVATPRSARGKLVRGLLTVTARGRPLSRHFAVYLR